MLGLPVVENNEALERFKKSSLNYLAICIHYHVVFKTLNEAVIKRKNLIDKCKNIEFSAEGFPYRIINYPMLDDNPVTNILFTDGYYYTVAACIRKMTEEEKSQKQKKNCPLESPDCTKNKKQNKNYPLEPNFCTMGFLPKEEKFNQNLETIKTFADKKLFHNEKLDKETENKVLEAGREFSNIVEEILFQLIKILKEKCWKGGVHFDLIPLDIKYFIKSSLLNKNILPLNIKHLQQNIDNIKPIESYKSDCLNFEKEVNTFYETLAKKINDKTTFIS
ncbi:MAG: hypothetical protein ACK5BE_04665 [Alphaproteobacteria bacterium]|jgi:hypothetical protein